MTRIVLATLGTLILGLPASVAAMLGIARVSHLQGQAAQFALTIGSCCIWTLLLFAVLWLALRKTGA